MKNMNYFPEESIVKDNIYMKMKDSITCKLCKKLLKDPMFCTSCQNTYCKNCLNGWVKTCPNSCENPNYIENISTKEILSKLKYECQNCGNQVKFEDIKSHLDSNCIKVSNKSKAMAKGFNCSKILRKLTPEETDQMIKNGSKISRLTSKKKKIFLYFFSYYIR